LQKGKKKNFREIRSEVGRERKNRESVEDDQGGGGDLTEGQPPAMSIQLPTK
jgi:hypothetical protein